MDMKQIIKQMMKQKHEIFIAMDKAIDKTFNESDEKKREEGRQELERLRGKDPAVPFFIGYAYEIEYICTKKTCCAQKAIDEYTSIVNQGYDFLKADIERLQNAVNSANP